MSRTSALRACSRGTLHRLQPVPARPTGVAGFLVVLSVFQRHRLTAAPAGDQPVQRGLGRCYERRLAHSCPHGLAPRLMNFHGVAGAPFWSTHRLAPQAQISISTRVVKMSGAGLFSDASCWWPLAPFVCIVTPPPGPAGLSPPGPEVKEGPGVLRARVADLPPGSAERVRCGRGGMLRGAGCSALDLCQVGGQVVGEPAVAGPEGLGFGRLSVPVMPDPSLKGSKATILSCRTRNGFRLPAKWMCLVVRPSIPVPACTVSSHSMGRLRKELGRWYTPRATRMLRPWEAPWRCSPGRDGPGRCGGGTPPSHG